MDNKTITIFGSFKKGQIAFNGQTSKVRNYAAELKEHFSQCKIVEIDTGISFGRILRSLVKCIISCLNSDVVCILPGGKGIRVILPITSSIKRIKGYLLLYPVVGGWLPEYAQKHKSIARQLHIVDRIYVETKQMKRALENEGFRNVEWAPVFTRRRITNGCEWCGDKMPYALCFFSRVTPLKGVDLAISAVDLLNTKAGFCKYTLDIYGKMDPEYEPLFNLAVNKSVYAAVKYGGALEDTEVMETLAAHWALLFPTSYPGEGFPATVLEGMMAGLPVIASDWRYNNEIIEEGYNGFLFKLEDKAIGLAEKIDILGSNKELAETMHANAKKKAMLFTPANILEPMFSLIEQWLRKD